jgi:hypothetical protein
VFAPKGAKLQTKTAESSPSRLVPHRSTLLGHSRDPVEQALSLQRTIGNQATLRLLASQAQSLSAWSARPGLMQPKLAIGPDGGHREHAEDWEVEIAETLGKAAQGPSLATPTCQRPTLQRQDDDLTSGGTSPPTPAPAPPYSPRIPPPPVKGDREVFVCTRPASGTPALHSFFRVGDPTTSAENSFSLFPQNRSGSDQNPCWQGDVEPDNDVDRRAPDAVCESAKKIWRVLSEESVQQLSKRTLLH